jgi:hypothetical protein
MSDVQSKMDRARTYLNNNLENQYVNNCERLKTELRQVPQALHRAHTVYLQNKILDNSGKYSSYRYQSEYNSNIYAPLKNEINELSNDFYNVSESDFDTRRNLLMAMLDNDNTAAYSYFSSR